MEVRMRLTDPRLGRVLDSMDVCQSVMCSFFLRAAAGQYELNTSQDLIRLLVVMARNKLARQVRDQRRDKRDNRRVEGFVLESHDAVGADATPSQIVAGRELLDRFHEKLNAEERHFAERRANGEGWDDIATAMGGTGQGRRKQLERAIARVMRELGLDDEDDEAAT